MTSELLLVVVIPKSVEIVLWTIGSIFLGAIIFFLCLFYILFQAGKETEDDLGIYITSIKDDEVPQE